MANGMKGKEVVILHKSFRSSAAQVDRWEWSGRMISYSLPGVWSPLQWQQQAFTGDLTALGVLSADVEVLQQGPQSLCHTTLGTSAALVWPVVGNIVTMD
jgi:hypothetical protein